MAKERLIKLPQTKGEFKLSGIVTGTQKGDKFFTNKKTKKGNDMNLLNFGVETNKDSTVYISSFRGIPSSSSLLNTLVICGTSSPIFSISSERLKTFSTVS